MKGLSDNPILNDNSVFLWCAHGHILSAKIYGFGSFDGLTPSNNGGPPAFTTTTPIKTLQIYEF